MREQKELTVPLNSADVKTYGKKGFLKSIFQSKRGYIQLPADISLEGLDLNEEELN